MVNNLSFSIQQAHGLKGFMMFRQWNYTVFFENLPERIILEAKSIARRLSGHPQLEEQFRIAKGIGLDGWYYVVSPHHRQAMREFEVPDEVVHYLRSYSEIPERRHMRVLLIVSTDTKLSKIVMREIREKVGKIINDGKKNAPDEDGGGENPFVRT